MIKLPKTKNDFELRIYPNGDVVGVSLYSVPKQAVYDVLRLKDNYLILPTA